MNGVCVCVCVRMGGGGGGEGQGCDWYISCHCSLATFSS